MNWRRRDRRGWGPGGGRLQLGALGTEQEPGTDQAVRCRVCILVADGHVAGSVGGAQPCSAQQPSAASFQNRNHGSPGGGREGNTESSLLQGASIIPV